VEFPVKNQPIPERSGARESAGPVIQDFQQTTMASKGLLVLAPTHSFTPGLKPSIFRKSFPLQPFISSSS